MHSISAHALDLVQAALLASFWRHDALKRFLRRHGIAENALSHLSKDMTKRQYLDWLFPKLEASEKGKRIIKEMARTLSEQSAFPDLENWPDSECKKGNAKLRVSELAEYLRREIEAEQSEEEKRKFRERAQQRRARLQSHDAELCSLKSILEELLPEIGSQKAGYAFQSWFGRLANFFEVPYKKPYRTSKGREVDGSLTVAGMTYLLSMKFTKYATPPADISEFRGRLLSVADYTMGIFISISGYTDAAKDEASGGRTNILLLDHTHLYYVLQGLGSMSETVSRVKEHASRTGESYLPVKNFGQ